MTTKGKTWNWTEDQKKNACGARPALKGNVNGVTHGLSQTRAYNSWKKMMKRCTDPNNQDYANYGGRGIKVCERWHDIVNFYEDMGERRKGFSIERLDVNEGYYLDNCFWMPMALQAKNRREWKHSPEGLDRIREARKAHTGWKHTPEAIAKMKDARKRDLTAR